MGTARYARRRCSRPVPPAAMAQLPAKEDRVLTMLLEKKVGVQTREKAHCVRDWARGPDLMLQ